MEKICQIDSLHYKRTTTKNASTGELDFVVVQFGMGQESEFGKIVRWRYSNWSKAAY